MTRKERAVRCCFAVAISALAVTMPWHAAGSEQEGWSDTCYAQLTMRQVQTRDYSYEVLQNCEIVPRASRGPLVQPWISATPNASRTALKSEKAPPRRRRP